MDIIPVVPLQHGEINAQMEGYAEQECIRENLVARVQATLDMRNFLGYNSACYIGGLPAKSIMKDVDHNVIMQETGLCVWIFSKSSLAVCGPHMSAGLMSRQHKPIVDSIKISLYTLRALSDCLNSNLDLSNYNVQLDAMNKEQLEKVNINREWIIKHFGENAVKRAKDCVASILHQDLQPICCLLTQ